MLRSEELFYDSTTHVVVPRGVVGPATERPHVLIVDDDEAMQDALRELMLSVGHDVTCFQSTRELLATDLDERPGCLVLDVRMPGLSGLDLQRQLVSSGNVKPIVFLTGHGDIQMTVQAMKAGAVDFLTKPFRDQVLLDAVAIGIERDVAQRAMMRTSNRQVDRFAKLTSRERQVFKLAAHGRLNKQIAFDLGISQVTVKLHRRNAMRKMQVATLGALIRAWETLPSWLPEKVPP